MRPLLNTRLNGAKHFILVNIYMYALTPMRLSMASALAVAVGPLQVVVDPVVRPWRSIRIRIRCALQIKDSPLVLYFRRPSC